MSTSEDENDAPTTPPDRSTVLLLLGDIADTTWRMFLPVIIATGLGVWGDTVLDTAPYLALVGVLAGSALAGLLIKKQLEKVQPKK